jgi:YfiH family protein
MERWNFFTRNNIQFISLQDWLDEGVNAAFSTRYGGVSGGVYDSLNMGLHVVDDNELVLENRRRFLAAFDTQLDNAVCCQQVHGNLVTRVDRNDQGRGAYQLGSAIPSSDAMITNVAGVHLLSFYADCVPVYLYDPVNRAIGIAHCGWKGTMGRIAVHALAALQREYGTRTSEVQIFIGPGIGPCCFQIQPDLAAKVNAEFPSLHDIITYNDKEFFSWNLQETNRQLLIAAGVKEAHISTCELCTACHTEIFYSYRRENGKTGRMGALIGLEH